MHVKSGLNTTDIHTEEDQFEFLTPRRGVDVDVTNVNEQEARDDKDDLSAGVHTTYGDFAEMPLYHGDIAVNYRADDEQDGGEEEHVLVAVRQLHLEHGQCDGDEGTGDNLPDLGEDERRLYHED